VTGTKGKSTTAALAAHLLSAAGEPAQLAGNIGVPAIDLLDADPGAAVVLELSSYQIADLDVGPQVAVFTNLYREHLDWHGSESAYRGEKLRLLELPGVRVRVLSARDAALRAIEPPGEVRRFGAPDGWDISRDGLTLRGQEIVAAAELPLLGMHNALNLCAALAAIEAFGVAVPPLPASLAGFRALPHRLQVVADCDGVLWVDDSISTTPESTLAAMASFPDRELVLIAGGQDRGQDHGELARELARRRATVVGVPSTGGRLVAAAKDAGVGAGRALTTADLAEAVALARSLAGPAGVVLLSPAAPSYDHYRDFEERGRRFAELARAAG
jgi:UDP-N-acetylmuramoylalanine--D-glutamate ligase